MRKKIAFILIIAFLSTVLPVGNIFAGNETFAPSSYDAAGANPVPGATPIEVQATPSAKPAFKPTPKAIPHSVIEGLTDEPKSKPKPTPMFTVSDNNHYLIKYKGENKKSKVKNDILSIGGKVKNEYKKIKAVRAELSEQQMKDLMQDPDIETIEPDVKIEVESETETETIPWGVQAVNATVALYGGGVRIGVLDSGVSSTHPDLNIAGGVSFVDGVSSYNDDNGHGTFVTGIINSAINGQGIIGVAPQAEIYVVKVIGADGTGRYSTLIEGIEWCILSESFCYAHLSL